MKKKESSFHDIGEILRSVIPERKFDEADSLKMISEAWDSLIPQPAAGHSRPLGIDRSVLTIGVDHPVWKVELDGIRKEIVRKAAKLAPRLDIREVKFVLSASRSIL